jgi:hypothetical protein
LGADGFDVDWRLAVDDERADELAKALTPDTDEHADIQTDGQRLTVEGQGPAGESLHTLDDVLACLSAAEQAREAADDA